MHKSLAILAAAGFLCVLAPAARADRIVIPVFQNQSAVMYGQQGQTAGGGYGNTSQTGVLNQTNQQSQAVNVYVPDDFKGNVTTRYIGGNRGEARVRVAASTTGASGSRSAAKPGATASRTGATPGPTGELPANRRDGRGW